jgi:hypothetical protein
VGNAVFKSVLGVVGMRLDRTADKRVKVIGEGLASRCLYFEPARMRPMTANLTRREHRSTQADHRPKRSR